MPAPRRTASPLTPIALLLGLLAGAGTGGPAAAAPLPAPGAVELAGPGAGTAAAPAGDVNGDGAPDLIVSTPLAGARDAGAAEIVLGPLGAGRIDLAGPGGRVIRLEGTTGSLAGRSVAGAGDLNGDGYDDVAIGAPQASVRGRPSAGAVYVVFGGPALPPRLGLDAMGAAGVRIDGAAGGDLLGTAVAAAGDVNGDGVPDLVVGASGAAPRSAVRGASHPARAGAGAAYVILGRVGVRSRIDLRRPGRQVVRIDGAAAGNLAGFSVAAAGDVDGDGRGDVLIGAPYATGTGGRGSSGAAYLVRPGGAPPAVLDLRRLAGGAATRMDGAAGADLAGSAVSPAGDLNGDGVPDLVVGAPGATSRGRAGAGAAFVAFGQRPLPRVLDLGSTAALRLDGAAAEDGTGAAVAAAGDLTGDGIPDLLVGAPGAGAGAGAAYLVPGPRSPGPATDLGGGGAVRDDGTVAGGGAGFSVAVAPGLSPAAAVLVGAPALPAGGRPAGPGVLYVTAPAAAAAAPAARGPRRPAAGQVAQERGPRRVTFHARLRLEDARPGPVSAASPQPALRHRGVALSVTARVSGLAAAFGTVTSPARTVTLRPAQAGLQGGRARLFLTARPGSLSPFHAALARGQRVVVKVTVFISDSFDRLTFHPQVRVSG